MTQMLRTRVLVATVDCNQMSISETTADDKGSDSTEESREKLSLWLRLSTHSPMLSAGPPSILTGRSSLLFPSTVP